MIDGIEYDTKIGEYVATAMTGEEVYGTTRAECKARLRNANRAYIKHLAVACGAQVYSLRGDDNEL